jgi:hypothetical protein
MARRAVSADPLELVAQLTDIGTIDTVYRDVYLRRAETLLAGTLPLAEFRRIEQEKAELATLPVLLGRALERADWPRVKELSSRGDMLRRSVQGKQRQLETARGVYVVTDVRLDPFSPGLEPFTRTAGKSRSALRTQGIEELAALEQADPPGREFYARRRAALQALTLTTSAESPTAAAASIDPREAAQRALKAGDMGGLAKLAETLMAAASSIGRGSSSTAGARATAVATQPSADILTDFSGETVQAARRLGLAPRRLDSRAELASLSQYAWDPVFADESRMSVKQVPLPPGTPEEFRERLEMLMIHPAVNSGGARHFPKLVAEDVLVEDFPDPAEGEDAPMSGLLTSLGLTSRRALPRIAIEQALLDRGGDVLEQELRLDPRVFRLVCIPPDVHLRLGEAEGWGRQRFWTHFDGYLVMADGRLRALAGGEAQYGGLFNLLGLSRDYDSDRLMARFAVVRRERMEVW